MNSSPLGFGIDERPNRVTHRPARARDSEAALGTTIPGAVVALVIARGASLARLVEETQELAAFSRTSHGLPSHLIAFDSWGEWPRFSAGFRPTSTRGEPPLVVWDWKTWSPWKDHPARTIADYVRRRIGGIDADEGTGIELSSLDPTAAFRHAELTSARRGLTRSRRVWRCDRAGAACSA